MTGNWDEKRRQKMVTRQQVKRREIGEEDTQAKIWRQRQCKRTKCDEVMQKTNWQRQFED